MARVISITSKVEDQSTKALGATAAAARKLGEEGERAGKKLADVSARVAKAREAELSASKQVELAIRKELAAGAPLQKRLVELEREYQTLETRMRAVVRAGGEVDASMARQAARARLTAEQLQQRVAALDRAAAAQSRQRTIVDAAAREESAANAQRERSRALLSEMSRGLIAVGGAYKVATFGIREFTENTPALGRMSTSLGEIVDHVFAISGAGWTQLLGLGDAAKKLEEAAFAMQVKRIEKTGDERSTQEIINDLHMKALPLEKIRTTEAQDRAAAEREIARARAEANRHVGVMPAQFGDVLRDLQASTTISEKMKELRERGAAEELRLRRENLIAQLDEEEAFTEALRREEEQRAADAERAAQQQARAYADTARKVVGSLGGMFTTMIEANAEANRAVEEGTMTAAEAAEASSRAAEKAALNALGSILQMAIETAIAQIAAETAKGSAAAVSAHAGIPFVGPALGAAAAAGISALIASVATFAEGGIVTGGIAGRDSVPALLMPGELVLPADLTRQLLGLSGAAPGGRAPLPMASGGVVPAGGPGMTPTVNLHFSSLTKPSPREADAIAEAISGALERRNRDGKFFLKRSL